MEARYLMCTIGPGLELGSFSDPFRGYVVHEWAPPFVVGCVAGIANTLDGFCLWYAGEFFISMMLNARTRMVSGEV